MNKTGYIDIINESVISGWVHKDPGEQETQVPEIRINGEKIGCVQFTTLRPDVLHRTGRAGIGLYFAISKHLIFGRNDIEVFWPDSLDQIPGGKKTLFKDITTQGQLLCSSNRITDIETSFCQFRSLLKLKGVDLHVPPKHLQIRVSGDYYSHFFDHGKEMFEDIERIIQSQGLSFTQFQKVLDFGCGCGRFLIPLSLSSKPWKLYATDIDQEAIDWLRTHYPAIAELAVNKPSPPTKYSNDLFDFVFSISIFTHLPEQMQHDWLAEMSRIIKPGGFGMFTVHGEKFYSGIPKNCLKEFLTKGFSYQISAPTDGLPNFYRSSFHTHHYIMREWSKYFEVLYIEKEGIGKNQDAVLVRKRR
jgi:2-polyprenyl-3-methyl-5-hydroxy-6-metoxy-1,4-benzoquinol methylase